jgi:hypothetical protein
MAGVKGKTNNPNGRPPKNKALTSMLETALAKSIAVGDKQVSGKRVLADMIASCLTTGRLRFPNDEEESIISIQDWLGIVKWAYERIDGKPVQPIEGTGDNGQIVIKVVYDDK